MPGRIHPTAIVDPSAQIGEEVEIGPYVIIGPEVVIGARTSVMPHTVIDCGAVIGEDCKIDVGAVIGRPPQDLTHKGGRGNTRIGSRTVVREYAQIHHSLDESTETVVGDDCLIMATAHIAHDCRVGNHVIVANGALLAGFVEIEDRAFLSGNAVVHQFARIGAVAMIAGGTRVSSDVPPYMMATGESLIVGINVVGLKRAPEISEEARHQIKEAYRIIYRSGKNVSDALEEIESQPHGPEVTHLVEFIRNSKRGICKGGKHR